MAVLPAVVVRVLAFNAPLVIVRVLPVPTDTPPVTFSVPGVVVVPTVMFPVVIFTAFAAVFVTFTVPVIVTVPVPVVFTKVPTLTVPVAATVGEVVACENVSALVTSSDPATVRGAVLVPENVSALVDSDPALPMLKIPVPDTAVALDAPPVAVTVLSICSVPADTVMAVVEFAVTVTVPLPPSVKVLVYDCFVKVVVESEPLTVTAKLALLLTVVAPENAIATPVPTVKLPVGPNVVAEKLHTAAVVVTCPDPSSAPPNAAVAGDA